MITVIDMASGELICSTTSTTSVTTEDSTIQYGTELPMPALALQEVQVETASNAMPPELADVPVAAILAKFE